MSLFACVCVCVFVSLAKLHVLLRVLKRNKMSKNNVYKKSKYRQNLEKRTVSAFENRVSGSVFLTCFWWLFKTNSGMLLYSTKKNDLKHRVRATGHARLTLKTKRHDDGLF